MDTRALICAALLLGCAYYARGQECTSFTDCRSCIQSPMHCQWCAQPNITRRCTPVSSPSSTCEAQFLQNPTGAQTISRNEPLSNDVQITPQAVSLRVRPGQPQSIPLTLKPAAVFPLDVYFLMDFSNSMKDDLATLQSIAVDIANDINSITNNFTLGFGSFVDKRTSPYVDVRDDQLRAPCREADGPCEGPYSYRHFLALTNNSAAFSEAVNNRIISGNLDSPEGGIDGMLQAVVCDNIIGWRDNPARRLLVYMTDASFHYGADGKIGGAVTPHDGQCHLRQVTDRGETYYEYEESLRLDYPSIAMVNNLLVERGISPIFLVTSSEQSLYQGLQSVFDNAVVGRLDGNSQNLFTALNNAYNELVSTVRLIAETVPGLEVSFTADCGRALPDADGGCTEVDIGSEITITATFAVTECTERLINGTSFRISSALFGEVTVQVQGVCSCDCEMDRMLNSSSCSNQGDLVCGLCECVEGRIGEQCQCDQQGNSGSMNLMCRTNSMGDPCSGPEAGECVCGQCRCRQDVNPEIPGSMYFGEICECNNFQCGVDTRGRLCSGNGECGCNSNCTCNEGFSGDICECRPIEECRRNPGDAQCSTSELCSGVGSCLCGMCTCRPGYTGTHCEDCTTAQTCGTEECMRYIECITCLYTIVDGAFQETGAESCAAICAAENATVAADTISGQDDPRLEGTISCFATIEGQCSGIPFYVRPNNGSADILVSNSPTGCAASSAIPAWQIAVPIVVGLLVLGFLAILLARLILFLLDRYEYQQFKKEVGQSQFGPSDNPLYKSANQEFQNPAYGGAN